MPYNWNGWRDMARSSMQAAQSLETQAHYRSCASRLYYGSYQAVTAVLLYQDRTPPEDREAWNHENTPQLIIDHWHPYEANSKKRRQLANILRNLYRLRISADYVSNDIVDKNTIRKAAKDARFLMNVVENILPGLRTFSGNIASHLLKRCQQIA